MSDWCLVSVRFLDGFLVPSCFQVSDVFIVSGWCLVGGCLYSGLVLDCFWLVSGSVGFCFLILGWCLSDIRLVSCFLSFPVCL